MGALTARYNFLFRSTKGLILVAIALIALVTAIWGLISGPMAEFGVRDFVIRLFGMDIVEAEREGRIILLYHAIAMAVVAIEVYIITEMMAMKKHQQTNINAIITFGYIFSLVFGLLFGYFGHNFIFHGLYILGLSLMFFGGLQLAAALWPWKKEYYVNNSEYAHTRKGINLERVAFFIMAVATLGSAVFGAITGSYWGNGHETFLAEDLIRLSGLEPGRDGQGDDHPAADRPGSRRQPACCRSSRDPHQGRPEAFPGGIVPAAANVSRTVAGKEEISQTRQGRQEDLD